MTDESRARGSMTAERTPLTYHDYEIGWICALPCELASAQAMFDEEYESLKRVEGDDNLYHLGRIGKHNIVIVSLPANYRGANAAAVVSSSLRRTFPSIKFLILVGVGGGVPDAEDDVRLGDVVVGLQNETSPGVIQFDMGKHEGNGQFHRTGALNCAPWLVLSAVQALRARYMREGNRIAEYIDSAIAKWPAMKDTFRRPPPNTDLLFHSDYAHTSNCATCSECDTQRLVPRPARSNNEPQIFDGLIASSNSVVKDSKFRDRLKQELHVLCVEMEAAGIQQSDPCLVIRGICDYADSHKTKIWQPYASCAAAAYAKELIYMIPEFEIQRAPQWGLILRNQNLALTHDFDYTSRPDPNLVEVHQAFRRARGYSVNNPKPRSDSQASQTLRPDSNFLQSEPMRRHPSSTSVSTNADGRSSFEDVIDDNVDGFTGSPSPNQTPFRGAHVRNGSFTSHPQGYGNAIAQRTYQRTAADLMFIQSVDNRDQQVFASLNEESQGEASKAQTKHLPSLRSWLKEWPKIQHEISPRQLAIRTFQMLAQPAFKMVWVSDDETQRLWFELLQNVVHAHSPCGSGHGYTVLHHLVTFSHDLDKEIEMLIDMGADINAIARVPTQRGMSVSGQTPLHCSVRANQIVEANVLLSHGCNITCATHLGNTALHIAAEMGYVEISKDLLRRGADLEAVNNSGFTPLLVAVRHAHSSLVELFLSHGANLEARCNDDLTPLMHAISGANLDLVKLLVKLKADVNCLTKDKVPLLVRTISKTQMDVFYILLESGADVNNVAKDGLSALHVAVDMNELSAIRKLLLKGADVNAVNARSRTVLMSAAEKGDVTMMKEFLAHNAELNRQNKEGETALYISAKMNRHRTTELLITHNANRDIAAANGETPLMAALSNEQLSTAALMLDLPQQDRGSILEHALTRAVRAGDIPLARVICDKGAVGKNVDTAGHTPLLNAMHDGKDEMTWMLLEHDIAVDSPEDHLTTPLHYAVQKGDTKLVKVLLEKHARTERCDAEGLTPLLLAVTLPQDSIIKLLLEHGANPNAQDNRGETALLRIDPGRYALVVLLVKNNADVFLPNHRNEYPLERYKRIARTTPGLDGAYRSHEFVIIEEQKAKVACDMRRKGTRHRSFKNLLHKTRSSSVDEEEECRHCQKEKLLKRRQAHMKQTWSVPDNWEDIEHPGRENAFAKRRDGRVLEIEEEDSDT